MPAFVEIAYDNVETLIELVLPKSEYWLSYFDPDNLAARVMRISCMKDDGFTKVEIGNTLPPFYELELIGAPDGLTDKKEEIWEISDGEKLGLVAVTHSAILVSDYPVFIHQ